MQVLFSQRVSVLLGLTTRWAQFDTLSVFERWKIVMSQPCLTQNLAVNVSYCWNWKPLQNFPRQVEILKSKFLGQTINAITFWHPKSLPNFLIWVYKNFRGATKCSAGKGTKFPALYKRSQFLEPGIAPRG